jgi:hypothetical protein
LGVGGGVKRNALGELFKTDLCYLNRLDSPTPTRMNTTMNSTTPARKSLCFHKKVTIYVEEEYNFNTFKQHGIKRRTGESDESFNTRCVQVWNKLCNKSNKNDVIEVKDEQAYDDQEMYNCESEIEDMIEEAIESIDDEEETRRTEEAELAELADE